MSRSAIGTLAVVGTGIQAGRHITNEARTWLQTADQILFCLSEPLTRDWIQEIRPDAIDLSQFYADGKDRRTTYDQMVESILTPLRAGKRVCAAFYGHPGIFVSPSFEAIKLARREGHRAFMLPGISAESCLYADLGIDPAQHGLLSYEASEWLVFGHSLDVTCAVILWQVDCVGDATYQSEGYAGQHVPTLTDALLRHYPPDHLGYIYQAAVLPVGRPRIWPVEIGQLSEALAMHRTSGTLYIPPVCEPPVDLTMAKRLGISPEDLDLDDNMPVWSISPNLQQVA